MKPKPSSLVRDAYGIARDYVHVRNGVDNRLKKSELHVRIAEYASIRKSTKIDENSILYESFWGRGITDNPNAIFKYLLSDERYRNFKHIWCVDDPENCAETIALYEDNPNVSFVQINTTEYLTALATAKYLINNVTFPAYFVKREGQVFINTWHGTPLKSMGYEQVNGNVASANTMRNFLQADYLLSANPTMTNMYLRSYKLDGILPGQVIEEGYPRNDLLRTTTREEIVSQLRSYGIDIDENKKLILYAPTWRDRTRAAALLNAEELINFKQTLEAQLGPDYQVIIKPHQFVYNILKEYEEYKGVFIPSTIDSNELMSIVDILVSDYSSIFFDYMVLSRPILFYITDEDQYAQQRGLTYELDDLPGPRTDNLDQLADYIAHIDEVNVEYAEQYELVKEQICSHDDGNATKRIVDYIFAGDGDVLSFKGTHEKKRLLLSIGMMWENGIIHSFLSLLNAFDYDEWDVTAYVSHTGKDEEMLRKINEEINPNARVLVRTGPIVSDRKTLVRREFIETRGLYSNLSKSLYPYDIPEIEFKRAFGEAEFDYIVDFCGYGLLSMPMLASGNAIKKSAWLHNDIYADMHKVVLGKKQNYVSLNFAVSVYPKYDHLVSCGRSVMEVNRANLATDETYDRFSYAKNTFDMKRFKKCEEEKEVFTIDGKEYYLTTPTGDDDACSAVSFFEMPSPDCVNFVTMGRFSTEKNQLCLVEAFGEFVKECPQARLYIIGGGPLEAEIRKKIDVLGLDEQVHLTGRLQNPYALMKRCNCFILPSLHEGQPLVLLEARACKLPIIVSNFSSVKDSLVPDGQLVIEPTKEGIHQGLKAFVDGEVPYCDFDVEEYNHEAYQEFINAIM